MNDRRPPRDADRTVDLVPSPVVWRLDLGATRRDVAALRACLSRDELARVARFRRPHDVERYAATRGALRHLLGRALDRPPERLAFAPGPYGKPRLAPPDDAAGLAFNVAHSGDVALIALAQGAEVGVDVERIRSRVAVDRLAERLFSAAERAQLEALGLEARHEAFFALWAAKEAVVKALGRGLFARLDGFDVRLDAAGKLVAQRVGTGEGESESGGAGWWLAPIEVGEGYRGAVAVGGGRMDVSVGDWRADEV